MNDNDHDQQKSVPFDRQVKEMSYEDLLNELRALEQFRMSMKSQLNDHNDQAIKRDKKSRHVA